MSENFKASCLCGAIQFEANGPAMIVGNCYCVDCRKSSGTSHCTHVALSDQNLVINGNPKNYERPADSGNIIGRHFCGECGSPLFSTNSSMPGMVFFRGSALDENPDIEIGMSVYTSRAPGWSLIDETKPSFPEMPEGGPEGVLDKS